MFTDDVNAACINTLFSGQESCMHDESQPKIHESMTRLLECAKKATKSTGKPIHDLNDLRNWMLESAQTFNNWKGPRGLSKEGALKAEAMFGCSANYVLLGVGEPGKLKVAEAENLAHALGVVARAIDRSDKIARLSLELLIAAIERDEASQQRGTAPPSAEGVSSQSASDNAVGGQTVWRTAAKKPPINVTAKNEQSVPVPHKRQSSK